VFLNSFIYHISVIVWIGYILFAYLFVLEWYIKLYYEPYNVWNCIFLGISELDQASSGFEDCSSLIRPKASVDSTHTTAAPSVNESTRVHKPQSLGDSLRISTKLPSESDFEKTSKAPSISSTASNKSSGTSVLMPLYIYHRKFFFSRLYFCLFLCVSVSLSVCVCTLTLIISSICVNMLVLTPNFDLMFVWTTALFWSLDKKWPWPWNVLDC
jgi:hypothetical protein